MTSAPTESSIGTGPSWTAECGWVGFCECYSLWSVSDAVVSDTGVVEVLALVLQDPGGVLSRELDMLAADGIGFGLLTVNELVDEPILGFSVFCGTQLE